MFDFLIRAWFENKEKKTKSAFLHAMMETDPALADDQLETTQIDDRAEKELAKFEIMAEAKDDSCPTSDADMKAFIKSL